MIFCTVYNGILLPIIVGNMLESVHYTLSNNRRWYSVQYNIRYTYQKYSEFVSCIEKTDTGETVRSWQCLLIILLTVHGPRILLSTKLYAAAIMLSRVRISTGRIIELTSTFIHAPRRNVENAEEKEKKLFQCRFNILITSLIRTLFANQSTEIMCQN